VAEAGDFPAFGLGAPPKGIVFEHRSVEFLIGGLFEEFSFAVVPLDMILAEEDPVGGREMKPAGGAIEGGVVTKESGAHGFAIAMPPDGLGAFWCAEADRLDTEGGKEVFLDSLLPGGIEESLDHCSGNDVAVVGVAKSFVRFEGETNFGDGEAGFDSLNRLGIGGKACGVAKELSDGGFARFGVKFSR